MKNKKIKKIKGKSRKYSINKMGIIRLRKNTQKVESINKNKVTPPTAVKTGTRARRKSQTSKVKLGKSYLSLVIILLILIIIIVAGGTVFGILFWPKCKNNNENYEPHGPYSVADEKLIVSVWNKEINFLFLYNGAQNIINAPANDSLNPGYLPISKIMWANEKPDTNNINASMLYWNAKNKCIDLYLHFAWNNSYTPPWASNFTHSTLVYTEGKVNGLLPNKSKIENGIADSILPNNENNNTESFIRRKNILLYLKFSVEEDGGTHNFTFVEAPLTSGSSNVVLGGTNFGIKELGKKLVDFMNLYKWYTNPDHTKEVIFEVPFNFSGSDGKHDSNISYIENDWEDNSMKVFLIQFSNKPLTNPVPEDYISFYIYIKNLSTLDDAIFNFYYFDNWLNIFHDAPPHNLYNPLYPVLKSAS